MIKGMTGFGSAQAASGKFKAMIELRSQNHRYLDLVFYLPIGFSSLEDSIRQMIGKQVKRGRVTVSIKITEKPLPQLAFNSDAIKKYLQYSRQIKKEFGIESDLKMSDLINLPGVVEAREVLVGPAEVWPSLEKGLNKALNGLIRMRTREGKSLKADISQLLKRMSLQVKKIAMRSKTLLKEKKSKLTHDEMASYQKGVDIGEELTRLAHYIDEFKLLLTSKSTVGKKMDFVAQEMQRETNTIGSKLQDKVVSNAVIAIKSKIEKLREQANNIE